MSSLTKRHRCVKVFRVEKCSLEPDKGTGWGECLVADRAHAARKQWASTDSGSTNAQ